MKNGFGLQLARLYRYVLKYYRSVDGYNKNSRGMMTIDFNDGSAIWLCTVEELNGVGEEI